MSDEMIDDFVLLDAKEYKAEAKLMNEFRLGETLAHVHAYDSSKQVLQIEDEDGVTRPYRVYPIQTQKDGVIAQMYMPLSGDNSKIYVNFTGTKCAHTAHADLEPNPGERSFLQCKKAMMHQINWAVGEVAKRTGKPVSIGIAGHSLGGALAQHATNECMRYCALNIKESHPESACLISHAENQFTKAMEQKYRMSTKEQAVPRVARENFDKVGQIKMYTWNAAGVGKATENYSNQISGVLSHYGVKLGARFGMVHADSVQQTGQGTVLSDSPSADVANLMMDIGKGKGYKKPIRDGALGAAVGGALAGLALGPVGAIVGGTFGTLVALRTTAQAHTAVHLQSEQNTPTYRYELLRNDTPAGHEKIKTRLQKKSSLLQNTAVQGAMGIFHGLGNFVKKCGSAMKRSTRESKTKSRLII